MRSSILTLVTLTSLAATGLALADRAAAEPWELLADIEITETERGGVWKIVKSIPGDLQASAEAFTISGFAVPIEAQPYISSFLLVQDPADCPFCGNSGYGPSLEVTLKRALPALEEGTAVTVSGRLAFDMSPETYQTVRLRNARLLEGAANP